MAVTIKIQNSLQSSSNKLMYFQKKSLLQNVTSHKSITSYSATQKSPHHEANLIAKATFK